MLMHLHVTGAGFVTNALAAAVAGLGAAVIARQPVQQAIAGLLGCALLADGAADGRQAHWRRADGFVPE